jgi:LAGLIDADG endonuclease
MNKNLIFFRKLEIKKFISNIHTDNFRSCNLGDYEFKSSILTPLYITGISDGEGSFQITIQDNKGMGKTGYKPFLEFKVTQRDHSVSILYEIKKYFGCGRINIDNSKTATMKFVITNNSDLMYKVIPHFDKYPLKTSKFLNYLNFKSAVILMNEKKHYDLKGINNLRVIKSNMNTFRSYIEKFDYCWSKDIIIEPEWLQGFIDGEGSFQCEMYFSNKIKNYPQINFSLQIQQNNHDVAVLYAIKNFLQCGYLKPKYDIRNLKIGLSSKRTITGLWIRNYEVICRFVDLYPLYTIKRFDYLDWKRLIELKKVKAYLYKEGLELMKKIKNSMNNKRFK